eukprot:m.5367 g.5367  ORF g.5367 m.5367 type:complete len:129 (+) comp7606_c0_seq1:64-450(+)
MFANTFTHSFLDDDGLDDNVGEYSDIGGAGGFATAPDGLYGELDPDFNEPAATEDPYGDEFSDDDAYGDEQGYLDVGVHDGEVDVGGLGSDERDHEGPEDSYLAVDGEGEVDYGFADDARALENPLYE